MDIRSVSVNNMARELEASNTRKHQKVCPDHNIYGTDVCAVCLQQEFVDTGKFSLF